jgi:hypothetical protein
MIIFISCTKKKQDHPCKAKEMYQASQWFRGGWKYAESLHPDEIYILSAKYGLLRPDNIISPYEQTLNAAKDAEIRKWSIMVADQIKKAGINRTQKAIFLCGKNYRKYIKNLFKDNSAPCSNLGIGKQMQFFKEHTKVI